MRKLTVLIISIFVVTAFCMQPVMAQDEKAKAATNDKSKLSALEVVKGMDAFTNGFKDQIMINTFVVRDIDGSTKTYNFEVKQKGSTKRIIRFKTGEVKGMSILTEDNDRMYVYLPGYKRVRRIAAHNMNQSFVGSDYTNNDMAAIDYHKEYDSTIIKQDKEFWWVSLVPKSGTKSDYTKLEMKIAKDVFRLHETKYYKKDELVKVFSIGKIIDFKDGVPWPEMVQMKDARTGHYTQIQIHDFKINLGYKDSMFTTRQLQWAR